MSVWVAFSLTLLAGLATGIGSAMAFLSKHDSPRFLSVSLGFSAGVMVYVSLCEILSEATNSLTEYDATYGPWLAQLFFFVGIGIIWLIDFAIPEVENPHAGHTVSEMDGTQEHADAHRLKRMGLMTALALAIHNFPEGLATFISALNDPSLGISIAIAIAIHNIPEGISVSVPIYYATKSRRKAFTYSFLSGLAEPIGALIGYLILMPFMGDFTMGVLFAVVAGIMVYISVDELLPTARDYGKTHHSVVGFVAGMFVMALSLLMF